MPPFEKVQPGDEQILLIASSASWTRCPRPCHRPTKRTKDQLVRGAEEAREPVLVRVDRFSVIERDEADRLASA